MRICIVDEAGVEIGQGRDLQQLRNQFKRQVKESLQSLNRSAYERKGITEWDLGASTRKWKFDKREWHQGLFGAPR